ncbi:ribonuclease R [Effusibacillus dendaii]|uniref:Ribonuclease R n=1 Tax=Effusibacillus dendaii TaxID=2743772 RepID=A0A7I8D9V0_9BACL|nr:ribonuclease R [Effusibacillus dendaii]BCJ86938.1 ribonuclease R [Effusibacillus dendaii]
MEQKIVDFMKEKLYKPMTIGELKTALAVADGEEWNTFVEILKRMEQEGQIVETRTHRYGLPGKMNLVVGRLQGKAKGFGFVIPTDPEELPYGDIYVDAGDMNGAMHGDKVIVRVHKRRGYNGRREGQIIRILDRVNKTVVGTLISHQHYAFVTPDDQRLGMDVFIPETDFNGAADGMKVVVEITHYPEGMNSIQGKVIEVLGYPHEPGVDILAIIRKHGLPESFPDKVLAEAEAVPEAISEKDLQGRRDLRDLRMVTIDGEDAKDLDDAVSVERLPNGNIRLGVHIADVSYYVREHTALDQEAYNRGTSVYLVDRVIPMLPHRLSNGICSLNPKVDRLTLTCDMEWSPELELVSHSIYPSVIKTNERMTYTNVRKILTDKDPELRERYKELVADFELMEELAMNLRARRMRRGAIDFDFVETKVIVDREGKPVEIKKRERSVAEQIIEEFMLAANETVSQHFHWLNIPFVYRIHEEPDSDRIADFNDFIYNFGLSLKGVGNKVHPKAMQMLLEEIKGQPEERIISTVMLRSMKQAKYSPEPLGHFGLSAKFYSHFTSPIRRYPDLLIHRIIRETFENGGTLPQERIDYYNARLAEMTQHASERERLAVDAERETDLVKKVEFMEDKVGEEFEGYISGVTAFGMFVELDNSVEGLVHVSYLDDDYYYYNEKQYALVGERTGRTFRIGDKVKVLVETVNKEARTIDFKILEGGEYRSIRGGRRDNQAEKGGRRNVSFAGRDRKSQDQKPKRSRRKTGVSSAAKKKQDGLKYVAKKAAKSKKNKLVKL